MDHDDRITISRLEVRFDVEDDAEEPAFARLFGKYIEQWARAEEEERRRQQRAAAERTLDHRGGAR